MSAVQDGYDSSQIGLILGVGALPAVFGGLVAPVLLHRISQKKLFHITTMPWVFVALFCAGWSFIDTIALSGYMVISFMVELAGALLIPTMGSFLPQLVESKELERANSTQNFVLGICSAAGPAVVSFFMLLLNASAMWLVLAGCMCMSLVVQRSLPDLTPEQEEEGREGLLVDLRFFLRARTLVRVVTGSAVWHFVIWSLFMTQGPVLMRDLYDSSWAWGTGAISVLCGIYYRFFDSNTDPLEDVEGMSALTVAVLLGSCHDAVADAVVGGVYPGQLGELGHCCGVCEMGGRYTEECSAKAYCRNLCFRLCAE